MKAVSRLVAAILAMATISAAAIEPPPTAAAPENRDAPRQEQAPPAEPPAGPQPAPADDPPPADADDETLPPLPEGTVPSGPPPQRFNPTEKVRADFPVSFPIDI